MKNPNFKKCKENGCGEIIGKCWTYCVLHMLPENREPKRVFRVEWMHNGNWRMEENSGGTFTYKDNAKDYEKEVKHENPGLKTRIVEVVRG